jgi:putative membrane protein
MRLYAIKVLTFLAALSILAACAQTAGRGAPSEVAPRDAMFMRDAAEGSIAEIRLGQLAMQNAASEDVKRFGHRMVEDHTIVNQQLQNLAEKKDVSLPAQPVGREEKTFEQLAGLEGSEFDRRYMARMVKAHERTISEFQTQASTGQDPDVRAFADKNLPVLQQHLERARTLHDKVAP